MKNEVLFIILASISTAYAQALELRTPLSKNAAIQLLEGASVELTSTRGNRLSWKNDVSGSMVAHAATPNGRVSAAEGTWKINDKGQFCVSINWRSNLEEWCRFVVKEDDGYYLTRSGGEKVTKVDIGRK